MNYYDELDQLIEKLSKDELEKIFKILIRKSENFYDTIKQFFVFSSNDINKQFQMILHKYGGNFISYKFFSSFTTEVAALILNCGDLVHDEKAALQLFDTLVNIMKKLNYELTDDDWGLEEIGDIFVKEAEKIVKFGDSIKNKMLSELPNFSKYCDGIYYNSIRKLLDRIALET